MAGQGVRSVSAFWLGGSATKSMTMPGGVRSMHAFWLGGACLSTGVTVTQSPAWRRLAAQKVLSGIYEDDEEAMLLLLL
jgi:hypothetical protein